MKEVLEHIEKLKKRCKEFPLPRTEDQHDFTQFILNATEDRPALVIMPYNMFTIYGDQKIKEGELRSKKRSLRTKRTEL